MTPRAVVTAAGVISALGAGVERFSCALYDGRSAAAPSMRLPDVNAAEIAEFDPREWLGNKGIRVLDRSASLLAVASRMALCSAGLTQIRRIPVIRSLAWYVAPYSAASTALSHSIGAALPMGRITLIRWSSRIR